MTTTGKTVTGRRPHGSRQPIIDSSAAPVRRQGRPVEAETRGSGASPPPLLSAAEVKAHIPDSASRFKGRSIAKNRTVKEHEPLVSVGQHESRGTPDARYLGIADQALHQQEREAGNVVVMAGNPAHSGEEAVSPKSTRKTQREARYLLHYRQG